MPDDVRSGPRLRHGERADVLAGDQLRQVLRLLLGRAPAAELVDAEIGVRAVGEADRGRGAGDLLDRDAMGEIAHAGAAVLLGYGDPEQPERAELLPEVGRKLVVRVDLPLPAARSPPPRSAAPCRAAPRFPRRARSSLLHRTSHPPSCADAAPPRSRHGYPEFVSDSRAGPIRVWSASLVRCCAGCVPPMTIPNPPQGADGEYRAVDCIGRQFLCRMRHEARPMRVRVPRHLSLTAVERLDGSCRRVHVQDPRLAPAAAPRSSRHSA